MRKSLLLIAAIAITMSGFSQSQITGSVNTKPVITQNSTKATVGQLAYSTATTAGANFGSAIPDFTVLAYFNAADVASYAGDYINKISIACDPAGLSTDVTIKIWADTSGLGASPVYTQVVALADLVNGWNDIMLTTPYLLSNADVAFGFTASTAAGSGFAYDNSALAANEKGSYYTYGAGWGNLGTGNAGEYLNWNLIANVDDGVSASDAGVTVVDIPNWNCDLTATEQITATVKNLGTVDITTAFNIGYKVNGGTEITVPVTVPLAVNTTTDVSFTVDMSVDGPYQIDVYTLLTGDADNNNDTTTNATAKTSPNVVPFTVAFDGTTVDFAGWNNEDVNADGSTWGIYDITPIGAAHSGTIAALYQYSATNAADDYMYSNCVDLVAGDYTLKFWTMIDASYPEKLSVKIGQGQTPAAMTTTIVDLGTITNGTWEETIANFTIATAGTYNLGFYAYSDANADYIALDDVTIEIATEISNISANNINVYPNPTTGIITITNAENANINVYNQIGALVRTVENTNLIDLSDLENGTYIVKITTATSTIVKNIVLTK